MAQSPEALRGIYLLKRMESLLADVEALPNSERKEQEVVKIRHLVQRLEYSLVSTPRRLVWWAIDAMVEDGKINFVDCASDEKYHHVYQLIEKYGLPYEISEKITDEIAIDLLDAAMQSVEAWDFTKKICSDVLLSGRELHPLLLHFCGAALIVTFPQKKRGRSGTANNRRDGFLAFIADKLQSHHSLQLTRNATSDRDSVCSILSEVLAFYGLYMTEEAIRKAILKERQG